MRAMTLLMITIFLLAPLAGCTSEGDDDKNASDNTSEITAKANVAEAMVENSSSEDKVTSAEFMARLASGSQDTPLNTIQYWLTCERDGNSINTDSVYLTEERNVTAGENFEFIVSLLLRKLCVAPLFCARSAKRNCFWYNFFARATRRKIFRLFNVVSYFA